MFGCDSGSGMEAAPGKSLIGTRKPHFADTTFRVSLYIAGGIVVVVLASILLIMFIGGKQAFDTFGLGFIWGVGMEPGDEHLRRAARHHRHAYHRDSRPADRLADRLRHRLLPHRDLPARAARARSASRSSCSPPCPPSSTACGASSCSRRSWPKTSSPGSPQIFLWIPPLGDSFFWFSAPPLGVGLLTASLVLADHDPALHRRHHARRAALDPAAAEGRRLRHGRDALGGAHRRRHPRRARLALRRRLPRPWPRARRDDGRRLRHRQRHPHARQPHGALGHHRLRRRQQLPRSRARLDRARRPARPRLHPVRRLVRRACRSPASSSARSAWHEDALARSQAPATSAARRPTSSWAACASSPPASASSCSRLILWMLFSNGLGGLSLDVFTKSMAPARHRRRPRQRHRRLAHPGRHRRHDRRAARHDGRRLSLGSRQGRAASPPSSAS